MKNIAVGLLLCFAMVSAAAAATQRNVVIIYVDDRDDHISKGYMPKTEALIGGQGVTFKNSFVTTPVCSSSRASFHTGLMTHNHGVWAGPKDIGSWGLLKPQMA